MKTFFGQFFIIITFAGIVQGLFVVLLLNNKNVRKSRANFFLSILLILLSFSIVHILFAGAIFNHLSAQIYSVGDPTFLLIAPLLWLYTKELTGHRVSWAWAMLLHFLPFFLIVIFSLSLRPINSEKLLNFLDNHHRLVMILFWIMVVVQFSWYRVLVQRRWIAYQKFIQEEVSNKEDVDISWVKFFLMVFLLINLFFLFSLFASIHFKSGAWLAKTTALIFSLAVFALGYKGILQKELFQKDESIKPDSPIIPSSYEVVNKPDQELVSRLLKYMEEKKPYLNPELTLSVLSKDLSISRSQLSQLINGRAG